MTQLYPGEELFIKIKNPISSDNNDLDDSYNRTNHRLIIDQGRYPVDQLVAMFKEEGRMSDRPEYQRGNVWDFDRKSKLIESLIMNIPIPPVYLFEKDYNKYDILDGKQRISSIVQFFNNEYELEGLDVWTGLNGKRYDDLSYTFKNVLNRSYISSIVIMKESSVNNDNATLIRTIFERLNSGGIALTTQESRNAILSGPFNDMCKSIVSDVTFKKIFDIRDNYRQLSLFGNYKKVEDIETVTINYSEYPLRFFAYRQIDKMESGLSSFLDEYLKCANSFSEILIHDLKSHFFDVLYLANRLLSERPFRLNLKENSKPNLIVYDSLMQSLSHNIKFSDLLIKKKDVFIQEYYKLVADKKLFNGKYTHKKIVLERINAFDCIIKEIIANDI